MSVASKTTTGKPKLGPDLVAEASVVPVLSTVELLLLTYSVLYAVVSRVPFATFVVYMLNVLKFNFLTAASTLGLYCFGRLVAAYMAGMYPGSMTMFIGTFSGGLAWAGIVLWTGPAGPTPRSGMEGSDVAMVVCSFLLGLTETVTGVDTYLKIESLLLKRPPSQTQVIFRGQLITTCMGVVVAYMGGGFAYETLGLPVVGYVCLLLSILNCGILCLVFSRRRVYRVLVTRIRDLESETMAMSRKSGKKQSKMTIGGSGVKDGRQRVSVMNVDGIALVDDEKSNAGTKEAALEAPLVCDEMRSSWFLCVVVACFYFTTLGISTQFSIAVLYWQEVWSRGPYTVGTLMAVGEALGISALIIFSKQAVFTSPLTFHFGKPMNVAFAAAGMGACALFLTIDNMFCAAFGTIGVHICNVCVHSFQAELVGVCASGENFARFISWGYTVKRFANITCVFGSLVVFGAIGPQLCYHVIGTALLAYSSFLVVLFFAKGIMPFQVRSKARQGQPTRIAETKASTDTRAAQPSLGGVAAPHAKPCDDEKSVDVVCEVDAQKFANVKDEGKHVLGENLSDCITTVKPSVVEPSDISDRKDPVASRGLSI